MSNYFDLQNGPILNTPSSLTAPKITSIGYPGDDTAADPAGGQTITLTGQGFEAGASVIINSNAVGVVSVVSSTSITFTSPALSAGSYPIYVVNTDGGTAIAVPGIQYSGTPTWSTAAGSLGSYTETQAISNTVTATGDAPVTYSLFSGTLPTGATLNSANGLISGTSPLSASPTTYTFTIRATDAQQQDTNRQFSLTINPDVVTWSSPANNTTYNQFVDSAISNIALSATAASGQSVSYTANALPTGLSISGSNITGTPTVVANSSTLLTATAATTNATATRTINWVISVAADQYFEYVTTLLSASNPSSTFVTDASTNNFAVTVVGDIRPNNFNPYTPGYYSAYFDGTGDYLNTPNNAAFQFGTGSFTVEFWFYLPSTPGSLNGLIGSRSSVSSAFGISIYLDSTTLTMGVMSNAVADTNFSTTVAVGQWYHAVLVRSGTTISAYANGTRINTGSSTTNITGDSFVFGRIYTNLNNNYGTSYMSNVRLVKGTAVYDPTQSTITVPASPLTAIAGTSLLTCQSNRFIDNSTNNFTITRNGDTTISGFDPFAPNSSYSTYGSGYCGATSDFLRISPAGTDSFGTGDFTVECWLNPLAATAVNLSLPSANTNTWGFLTFNGQLYWQENGSNLGGTGYGTVVQQAWNHLAVCRSGTTIRWFVNGVQVNSTTNSFNYSGAPATRNIGPGSGGSAPAYISDFRIVKGTAVYTGAFTPPAAPLTAIANTSLLTLQNNQPNNNNMFLDSSTNNFLITRNGNTTQGSFSPYGGGWSNYFDGTGDYLSWSGTTIGTNAYSIECWFNIANFTTAYAIVGPLASNALNIRINNSTTIAIDMSGVSQQTFTVPTMSVNTWYHLAVVRNSSNVTTVFLNGARSSTGTVTMTNNYSAATGYVGFVGSNYFPGYISNLRIVVGSSVYDPTQSTITVPTAPLTPIAGTSLLTCADNRFIDDSANNFTITRNGDVTVQRFNPFNPVLTTPTSYSGYFDGTGDFLKVTNTNLSQKLYDLSSGDFTVEAWVYPTFSIWSGYNDVFLVGSIGMLVSAGKLIAYGFNNNPISGTVMSLNQWTHLSISRSSGTLRGFQNGVQVFSVSDTTQWPQNSPTRIGVWSGEASEFWQGYISNVRVSNNARYTGAFTPSTTPLTADANTLFLTCQSSTFVDNSTNNYTITANGNSQPTQFNPYGWTNTTGSDAGYSVTNYGGSMYFDGTGDYLTIPFTRILGTQDFTIEAWVYVTAAPGAGSQGVIFASPWGTTLGIQIFINDTLTVQWQIYSASGSSPSAIALRSWNHIAWTRTGGNCRLFINGVLVTTTADSSNPSTNPGNMFIGARGTDGLPFTGYISNLRYIIGQALYTSSFAPPVAPLSFNANTLILANGTSAAMYDSAMITTYETVGNASSTGVIKKYGNSSMYFDGTGDFLKLYGSPNFQFGTGDFTIECWFNGVSVAGGTLFDFRPVSLNGAYPCIYLSAGSVRYYVNTADQISGGSLSTSTWYHIAVCRSGTATKLFINGTQVGSTYTDTNNYGASSIPAIGATSHHLDGTGVINGYLDDFRITRGVARYTSNFTPTTTPFIQN